MVVLDRYREDLPTVHLRVLSLRRPVPHQVREFDLARVRRIWSRTLELHLGLYKGYVEQLNKLTTKPTRETDAEAFARRFAFEHNGVVLHELFFDALSGKATPMQRSGALAAEFKRSSGAKASRSSPRRSEGGAE